MIRALLWDADGVLQHTPHQWQEKLDALGGPGFADAVFEAELSAMCGEEPLRATLERLLGEWSHTGLGVADLLGLWEQAELDTEALAVVRQVRETGVVSALATNQQDHRRAWMRDHLGIDAHFDHVFYSCELGVAKPDPAYFTRLVEELGLQPDEVGFVDDNPANVESATSVGLVAVRHDPATGASALRAEVDALLAGAISRGSREAPR